MRAPLVIALIASLATSGCARGAVATDDDRVQQELARLESVQKKIESAALPEIFREMVAPNRKALDAAAGTTDPLLSLYRLRTAFLGIETLAFCFEHSADGGTIAGLETLWKGRRPGLPGQPAGSLLHEALRQVSVNRAEKLYNASLPYGRVSSPHSGLYYLAEADANARFATWIASLSGSSAEGAPTADRVQAAIDAVEGETMRVFEKDPAGRTTIGASAKLKEARELLERNSLAGATLTAVEARLALSRATAGGEPVTVSASSGSAGDTLSRTFAAMNEPLVNRDVLPMLHTMRRPD